MQHVTWSLRQQSIGLVVLSDTGRRLWSWWWDNVFSMGIHNKQYRNVFSLFYINAESTHGKPRSTCYLDIFPFYCEKHLAKRVQSSLIVQVLLIDDSPLSRDSFSLLTYCDRTWFYSIVGLLTQRGEPWTLWILHLSLHLCPRHVINKTTLITTSYSFHICTYGLPKHWFRGQKMFAVWIPIRDRNESIRKRRVLVFSSFAGVGPTRPESANGCYVRPCATWVGWLCNR